MTEGDVYELCKNIHKKCWNLFDYTYDHKQYMMVEHWKSHAEEVENNQVFKDDCDGFALTCAELLIKEGVPRENVSAIYCVVETGEDHLVCGVNTVGTTVILDNRYHDVYDWNDRPDYEWRLFMRFNEMGTWRKST